jgi:hypothetical protein
MHDKRLFVGDEKMIELLPNSGLKVEIRKTLEAISVTLACMTFLLTRQERRARVLTIE